MATRSSRVRLGDFAGLLLLMNAPCPHCEQISTRGSRMSMSVTTEVAGDLVLTIKLTLRTCAPEITKNKPRTKRGY